MNAGKKISIDTKANHPDEREDYFRQVMEVYGTDLLKLAYSYVKNQETAKDLVQSSFVSFYLNLPSFKGDSSIKTWLYRITANKCKDHLRSAYVRRVFPVHYMKEARHNENQTEKALMDGEFSEWLKDCIFKLPVKYREVIMLYYYQELSAAEIAEVLQVPESTVRTRLDRARKKLAPLIKEEELFNE
ncbi:sigma-70 family RNA polymerase sigma factor [Metabacillus sp. KIGAM252]|uniref:Sigma-70 family RNA polymerase sigma factor n=1 Tax=Metabacillus flavus TaxID=2823519 RepID=A0ABS5LAQ4_9BACI|nr:sigma-70 family RNA polymerase sigma factor [Metabacillus flavus]MBS2967810.1 sigma-70 family RNA polymerase sigma factor [Metabacillus flavus]